MLDAPEIPQRDPDNPPPSGPLTHWIDTNVMLEVYSHGDFYEAFERWQRGEGPAASIDERRVRMQGSLWMAMALCQTGARSVTFQHENIRNILRLAPPGSTRGAWTSVVLYVLSEGGTFDGWERHMTNDGEALTNRQRDAHMIEEWRSDGLVLVTRDAQVIGEALSVGVDAAAPETFASRHLKGQDAWRMFDQRLGDAAIRYLVAGPPHERNMSVKSTMEYGQRAIATDRGGTSSRYGASHNTRRAVNRPGRHPDAVGPTDTYARRIGSRSDRSPGTHLLATHRRHAGAVKGPP